MHRVHTMPPSRMYLVKDGSHGAPHEVRVLGRTRGEVEPEVGI